MSQTDLRMPLILWEHPVLWNFKVTDSCLANESITEIQNIMSGLWFAHVKEYAWKGKLYSEIVIFMESELEKREVDDFEWCVLSIL